MTERKLKYITTRTLKNKEGKVTGKVRIIVYDDNIARVSYKCPECGYEGKLEKEWKRPFSFKCENCGYLIRVPKLLYEVKKEIKGK